MSLTDDIIREIRKEIDQLPTGDFDEVIFKEALFREARLEKLLNQRPDVQIEGNLPDEETVLGIYIPMSSPGVVCLNLRNIRAFFWGLISECVQMLFGAFVTKPDLERVATLVTLSTYHHEVFHFNCDVLHSLFGGHYDKYLEEALAVAYSRMQVISLRANANSTIGRLNPVLYNFVLRTAYRYTSQGYRDWVNYPDEVNFKAGLIQYIQPGSYQKLESNGVSAEDLLFGILGRPTGFIERTI
ncbi:MAG: hypothetical protein ACLPX5_12060 [Dissulfurispiraceae bacterium]